MDDFYIVFFGVYIPLLIVICLVIFVPRAKAKKKYGKDEFLFFEKFPHSSGLNLPQNVMCNVFCLRSRIVIEANGQEFSLPAEKIIDVSVMTNKEIHKQYVSSVGGAVAGAMLLGPLGAALGGSATKKRIKEKSKYLIFTYKNKEDMKYILFDVTKKTSNANKFKNKFRDLKKNNKVKIEL